MYLVGDASPKLAQLFPVKVQFVTVRIPVLLKMPPALPCRGIIGESAIRDSYRAGDIIMMPPPSLGRDVVTKSAVETISPPVEMLATPPPISELFPEMARRPLSCRCYYFGWSASAVGKNQEGCRPRWSAQKWTLKFRRRFSRCGMARPSRFVEPSSNSRPDR